MSEIFWRFGDKSDSLEAVRRRGELWGVDAARLVLMEQTHSDKVRVVADEDLGCGFTKPALPVVDAICTNRKDILLVVKGADCVPILFYDPAKQVVAAAHSGRKGTQMSICVQVLQRMRLEYGSSVADLQVLIGPGVSAQHYEVSGEVYDDFVAKTKVAQPIARHLDLRRVIVEDLLRSGVRRENLQCNQECTFSSERYFSYREDKNCGRQLSAIGVLDGTSF